MSLSFSVILISINRLRFTDILLIFAFTCSFCAVSDFAFPSVMTFNSVHYVKKLFNIT